MKKKLLMFGTAALAAISATWLNQGCAGKIPSVASVATVLPTPQPDYIISNFSAGTLNMNSFLRGYAPGSKPGYFFPEVYGGAPGHTNMINGNVKPVILVPNTMPSLSPIPGSAYVVHISGPQSDPSPTTYPAFSVFSFLKNDASNPYYDLTLPSSSGTTFTGIRFDVKIPTNLNPAGSTAWLSPVGDNNTQKRFAIATMDEVPPTTAPGGICPPDFSANCYNYFWVTRYSTVNGAGTGVTIASSVLPLTMPAIPPAPTPTPTPVAFPNNGWQPVSILFSDLKTDSGYGTNIPGGTALTATNLSTGAPYMKSALFLLWKFGDNGGGSNTYTDYWFDNVQFY
ncbi:MAG TPA: hypothetical protein VMV05_00550 [bacterium]|nr:hypothetical protein [bacterium]